MVSSKCGGREHRGGVDESKRLGKCYRLRSEGYRTVIPVHIRT
jgi:mRNA-degrading endonuclease RelE of RelBE toxin-antitoxin system